MREGRLRLLAVSLVVLWALAQLLIAALAPALPWPVRALYALIGLAALPLLADRSLYLPSAGAAALPWGALLLADCRPPGDAAPPALRRATLRGLPPGAVAVWWLPSLGTASRAGGCGVARAAPDGSAEVLVDARAVPERGAVPLPRARRRAPSHVYLRVAEGPLRLSAVRAVDLTFLP